MSNNVYDVIKQFIIEGDVKLINTLGEGFINDTFFVETVGSNSNYILQRKNKNIFTNIPAMMYNIERVCVHLKTKVEAAGGDPLREAMTVIRTTNGKLCYKDEEGEYWAVCLFIDDSISYQLASSLDLAMAGGKGVGRFQNMTSDLKTPLTDVLPGFHNIRERFKQWDEAIKQDCFDRVSNLTKEIHWIDSRREEMLGFYELIENNIIPLRVTHNDTKISNFLFDSRGDVLCAIDLDTVLTSTVLNDFGDAIRYYANTGLEDDEDLENIGIDMAIFEAFTKGYLSEAKAFLTQSELDNLAFSAKFITYEQVLRFLMDYINGDTYYKIKYHDHNLVRTHAQYELLISMEKQYESMVKVVKDLVLRL